MSAMLANAILKGNKSFTVTTDGNYTNSGIEAYMYWLGMDTGTFIGEDNDVPYAMNCHDVVYKGKVKNVIAIVVGEKDEYKGILELNSDDESYEHSGFVEKAEYIYDKFIDYDSTKSGDKVYWIVGYGTGGSVANILADRIVSAKGTESVYCYTFGAIDTIDREKIPEGEVIENEKNESIFNLKNIDDLSLLTLGNAWTSYGRDVTFSLADDETVKREFKEIVKGVKYDMTKKNMKSNVSIFKRLLDDLMEFMSNIFNWKGRIETRKIEENNKLASDIGAYIASTYKDIVEGYISAESYFGNDEYYEEDGMVSGFAGTQVNSKSKAYVSPINNFSTTIIDDDGLDAKDGYRFLNSDGGSINYNRLNVNMISKNETNQSTIKVNNDNYCFSNYTMKNEEVFCDIDFTKFWHQISVEEQKINTEKTKFKDKKNTIKPNAAHMHLFDIHAGDFDYRINPEHETTGKTLTTYSGYSASKNTKKIFTDLGYNNLYDAVENSDGVVELKEIKNGSNVIGKFIAVDGRIIAAFPYVAHVGENSNEYNAVGDIMHEFDNYNHPEGMNDGRFKAWGNNGGGESTYRYVDVVFEKDGDKKHQYVIPFMIVSVKDLHYLPKSYDGYNASFVDNRFGQVYQGILPQPIPSINAPETDENGWKLYQDPNGIKKYLPDDFAKEADKNGWQKIYLPHRDEDRSITRLSPIEPFINNYPGGCTNVLIRDSLLLTPKDKIVSMRVYKHKFDANDPRHFIDIRDDESKIKKDYQNSIYSVLDEEASVDKNIIINYSQINYAELFLGLFEQTVNINSSQ